MREGGGHFFIKYGSLLLKTGDILIYTISEMEQITDSPISLYHRAKILLFLFSFSGSF